MRNKVTHANKRSLRNKMYCDRRRIGHSRVAEPGVVEVVAHAGRDEGGLVLLREDLAEAFAALNEDVHHLGDAEAVAEIVEGVGAVGGADGAEEGRQRLPVDVKGLDQAKFDVHLLHQRDYLKFNKKKDN